MSPHLLALLAAAGLACTRPATTLTEVHATAMRDSVTTAMATLKRYSAAAQWDSLAGLYSKSAGFRFAETGKVQYRSAGDVRTSLNGVPGGTRIETTYHELEVDPLAPGVASVTTLFDTKFVDSTNATFSFGGVITMVWVHEPAGWRIRQGHSSTPVPRG
jgi:hypothetical protein